MGDGSEVILYFWGVVLLICAVAVACAVGAIAHWIGFSFWWGPGFVLSALAALVARGRFLDWKDKRALRAGK